MPIPLDQFDKVESGKTSTVEPETIFKIVKDIQSKTGKTVSMLQIYNTLKGFPLDQDAESKDWDSLIQDGGAVSKARIAYKKQYNKLFAKRINGQLEFKF